MKAVLFDFDGTLVDTNGIILASWQAVFDAKKRTPISKQDILASFGEPLWISMEKWFPGEADECIEIYRAYQKDIFLDRISLYPGVEELIRRLKTLRYLVAIVTSRLTSSTLSALDKFDLTGSFDTIITCDDTDKHKPAPEPVLLALARLGVSAEEAIMVGDSRFDIGCAHNAGVKAALVEWSMAMGEEAKKDEDPLFVPDFRIGSAAELLDILEEEA